MRTSPRFRLSSTVLIALTLGGTSAFAQSDPLSPPAALGRESAATVATGRIQQWLVNPSGDVDGLLLADGTQVGFPPHLSTRLLQNFKPGDTVQVTGWRAPNLPMVRARSLSAGTRRVDDQGPGAGGPPPPREPTALTAMSASGKVARLLYTARGDTNGVLLDNGSIVRFAPHLGNGLAANLQPGSDFLARGWGRRVAQGSAFEATAIGNSAENMRELFAGPGVEPAPPNGQVGPRGPGRAHPPRPPQPPRPEPGMALPVPPANPVPPASAS